MSATLGVDDLRRLADAGGAPRLIDVRTPGEFDAAHIAGSHNVPLDLLQAHGDVLGTYLDERDVLVCRTGRRAVQAADLLAGAGRPAPRIGGGITAWQATDAPVVTGTPRWDLERQVRLVAGSIVLVAVLASTVVEWVKWFAAFIGAGLAFAALTDTCAMGMLLAKLPYNRGPRVTLGRVVATLAVERR